MVDIVRRDDVEQVGQQEQRPAFEISKFWRSRPYAVDCLPTHEEQAQRLEALRVKWRQYRGLEPLTVLRRWAPDLFPLLLGLYLGWAMHARGW